MMIPSLTGVKKNLLENLLEGWEPSERNEN